MCIQLDPVTRHRYKYDTLRAQDITCTIRTKWTLRDGTEVIVSTLKKKKKKGWKHTQKPIKSSRPSLDSARSVSVCVWWGEEGGDIYQQMILSTDEMSAREKQMAGVNW